MSRRKARAYIMGAYEHPTRLATDKTIAQLHMESALGALADAGLSLLDVDGFFCGNDMPGIGAFAIVDYLNLKLRHIDVTDTGGSSYMIHVAHAVEAIQAGKCSVALITLGGRPRAEGANTGTMVRPYHHAQPEIPFELPYGNMIVGSYAMCAKRHMYEFGTTSEQLAWVKVAASHHAQHNERALLRDVVTVEEVVNSPLVADPLHRLDCCVITDGGGALIVTSPEVAARLNRPKVGVIGMGETIKGQNGGKVDLSFSAVAKAARTAFEEAAIDRQDIKYVSLYDSFTITVLMQIEDLGFCEKGQGGRFVADGNLISGVGRLPFNTDGGGLCNNHPNNRGGMTKIIEAVRQLRGEAHPAVQVKNCDLALASGIGGWLGARHAGSVVILEREA
ncbi:acetyl-CoA acetyltransferase [Nitratireductor aestuarii]|uniref:Acetyl-CoA acetyltransferase n=1 Tax=Nitratireductor aestuarii TaxID=1735103 RepID=A0A916W887_9HYPH|nr:thiolase domain-containing protein [Nitratireductor aestuarii]GGA74700.1 acetyl-CoA acetyltransferase [Nitratireductor aestuarii]